MSRGKTLREVVTQHQDSIMKTPGVIGVGVGLSPTEPGRRCVLVYATTGEWPPDLPKELDGYPVEIVKKSRGFRAL